MTEPDQTTPESEQPPADPDQTPQEPEQVPAEPDLNAILAETEQYSRDVVAEFEALGVTTDYPKWTQWCAEMDEWNAAVAAT